MSPISSLWLLFQNLVKSFFSFAHFAEQSKSAWTGFHACVRGQLMALYFFITQGSAVAAIDFGFFHRIISSTV